MSGAAQEIRCPSCGGAQDVQESEQYECRFCLTPFTFRHARDEEERLFHEIRSWVEQRVGGTNAVGGGTGIDASSRAYLFRKNLLPSLQMAHDRAIESTHGFQRFPLLPPVGTKEVRDGNPLLHKRAEIQTLKDLRARLASPDVGTFVVTDEDRTAIRRMDVELQEIQGLSNVVYAGTERTARGFAAARNGLEVLLEETDPIPVVGARYRALADLAGLLERVFDSDSPSGTALAPEAERIAEALRDVAHRLEEDEVVDVESSLAAVAARKEAEHAGEVARWLRSFDAIVRRVDLGFPTFLQDALAILEGQGAEADGADLIESWAEIQRSVRGEVPVLAHESFDWARPLGERERGGRWLSAIGLGFLGLTEEVGATEDFFIPFWLVDAGGKRWMVDACRVTSSSVFELDGRWEDVGRRLGSPVALRRPLNVAMPSVTARAAKQAVASALRQAGSHNAVISEPRVALLPGTRIEYRKKGRSRRQRLSCLDDRLSLEQAVLDRLSVGRRLQERFQ
jgi:hypothetical protein